MIVRRHSLPFLVADQASRIMFGILYWYIWTVALPQGLGYRLEAKEELSDDGIVITKLQKVRKEPFVA